MSLNMVPSTTRALFRARSATTAARASGAPRAASSAMTLELHNPFDGAKIGEVALDDERSVLSKHAAARAAQPAWAATPMAERLEIVERFRALMVARIDDELAPLVTSEMGKPLRFAKGELNATSPRLEFFTSHAEVGRERRRAGRRVR